MKKTESHEWVKLGEKKIVTVGITKKAAEELGEIVFVDLPQVGKLLQEGEEAVILESTKAASDSYAPLKGRVIEVNEALRHSPSILSSDPHQKGWLYKLEIDSEEAYHALPDYM